SCCAGNHDTNTGSKTAKDPVCGMMVDPAVTSHHASHGGEEFHFCSGGCRAKFAADPERYLSEDGNSAAVAQLGAIWTCPMHPEIRQD
ncbi:YHS domain-containing protein, partial [Salmonella enterica]|uniref:YHS domain-containing protein n=1 Tax=Salmonella enterica TaxID=28901 RepID=UPI003D2DDC75